MDSKIAWTPEGGDPRTMAVLLSPPTKPLTEEAYLDLLQRRFAKMVKEARQLGADPIAMASQRMGQWDDLWPETDGQIPEMLAQQSEALKTGMPLDLFPIKPEAIKEDGTSREAIDLMQFGDLLAGIYPA